MFSDDYALKNEGYFVNNKFSGNIDAVLPQTEFEINFKFDGNSRKKMCYIVAEKIDFQGLIQIRISDRNDYTKMFISTVDIKYFEQLRQDQSLHVTFGGFVDNLTKLLSDCIKGKLQISILKDNSGYLLQFFEKREFKNLTHLCLPLKEAPINVIIFYMNRILENLQLENSSYQTKLLHLQSETERSKEQIFALKKENTKIRDDLMEQEKIVISRYKDKINNLEENIRKISEERNTNDLRCKEVINNLQNNLDKLRRENSKLSDEKMQEIKKGDVAREEVCCLKSTLANLKEQNEKLATDLATIKNIERKNEMHLKDCKQHIQQLQDKIRKHEKDQFELKAELEAEKKICHTKKYALEMATEEINKANNIINKQTKELANLRKTIDVRTEVALQQEKVIKEKDKQILKQNQNLENLQIALSNFRSEAQTFPEQLENLKALADRIENKYNERLTELNHRIRSHDKGTTRR